MIYSIVLCLFRFVSFCSVSTTETIDNVMHRWIRRHGSGDVARQTHRILLRSAGNLLFRPSCRKYRVVYSQTNRFRETFRNSAVVEMTNLAHVNTTTMYFVSLESCGQFIQFRDGNLHFHSIQLVEEEQDQICNESTSTSTLYAVTEDNSKLDHLNIMIQ